MNQILNWLGNNLGAVVILLAVFGPIVANILRGIAKAGQRSSPEPADDASTDRPTPRSSRLDEMAARRRAELAQGGTASSGGDPSNLTMAERIARARAKAQYERRAAGLSEPRDSASARGDTPDFEATESGADRREAARSAERAQQERRRAEAEALQRRQEAERRQAQAAEQRRRATAESERRDAQQRQRARQSRRTGAADASSGRSQASPARSTGSPPRTRRSDRDIAAGGIDGDAISRGEVGTGKSAIRLQDADGRRKRSTRSSSDGGAAVFGVRLTQRTMRHAIVLREILDPPVSLRQGDPGMGTRASAS